MLRDSLQTAFNMIGLCRQYPRWPSFKPDKFIPSSLLAQSYPMASAHNIERSDSFPRVSEPPHPFPNMTIYCLLSWMNSGSHQKSEAEVMHLVKDVIQVQDFNPRDLDGFSVRKSLHALDNNVGKGNVTFLDDWLETDITINIPMRSKDNLSTSFSIPGFHYHLLVAVI